MEGRDLSPNQDLPRFCRLYLSVYEGRQTGTLSVAGAEGEEKAFYYYNGHIEDIHTDQDRSLLVEALKACPSFGESMIRKATKIHERSGRSLEEVMLEVSGLPEEEIIEAIRTAVEREVLQVFKWPCIDPTFQPGPKPESFRSPLGEFYEIVLSPEDVFLRAMRELDRWDLVRQELRTLKDVYYATPATFKYFKHAEAYPLEVNLISQIDGTRDLDEVISRSGIEPFRGLEVIRQMAAESEIELANPIQLFQIGMEFEKKEDFAKVRRLYERAGERGLADFDLELRLAHAYEKLGLVDEAIARYVDFADRCAAEFRPEDTIRSLRRVVQLDPDNLAVHERYVNLLSKHDKRKAAVEEGLRLAEKFAAHKDHEGGLRVLGMIQEMVPKDTRISERIIELADLARDNEKARAEREKLAHIFHTRKDSEKALHVYQEMFCNGNDSLDVRVKLVELHKERGNRDKAMFHLRAILSLGDRFLMDDQDTLRYLHEMMVELSPGEPKSSWWLVEDSLTLGDRAKAARLLSVLTATLEAEDDPEALRQALLRAIAVDDTGYENHWKLALVEERLGDRQASVERLREIAHLAMRRDDLDVAERAFEKLLKVMPHDLETHRQLVDLYTARGKKDLSHRKAKDVALLHLIAGNVHEAQEYCRRLLASAPRDAEIITRLGFLSAEMGDRKMATEQLLKATRIHLSEKNIGLARSCTAEAARLDPKNPEVEEALGTIRRLEAMMGTEERDAPIRPSTPSVSPPIRPPRRGADVFSPAPSVVKTSITGITERLRNVKNVPQASAPAAGRGGEEELPPPRQGSAAVKTANAGIHSAASKLRALAARGTPAGGRRAVTAPAQPDERGKIKPPHSPRAPEEEPPDASGETPSPVQALAKARLSSSASRLSALRKGRSPRDPEAAAPGHPQKTPSTEKA